jgi:hypothetical protein
MSFVKNKHGQPAARSEALRPEGRIGRTSKRNARCFLQGAA